MIRSLTKRLIRLEGHMLSPELRTIAMAVALKEGLDPEAVIQQAMVILRQIQEAGVPMTDEAVTAFLAPAGPRGLPRSETSVPRP